MEKNLIDLHDEGTNALILLDLMPDLLLQIDTGGTCIACNHPRAFGSTAMFDKYIGKNIKEILPGYIAAGTLQMIGAVIAKDSIEIFNCHFVIKNELKHFEARFVKCSDDKVLVIVRDITGKTKENKKPDFSKIRDSLTNAFSRNYFDEVMTIIHTEKFDSGGLMICDVDSLKLINDSLGHRTGDKIISTAANILRQCLTENELFFRIGGDEFVIISQERKMDILYEKIKKNIEQHNEIEEDIYLSISLGWQNFSNGKSVKNVFDDADSNMYHEKFGNDNKVREKIIGKLVAGLRDDYPIRYQNTELLNYLTKMFSVKLNLSPHMTTRLYKLSVIHDIGIKNLLSKASLPFDPESIEFYRHCEIGFRILNMSKKYSTLANAVLKHHENWNGSGYPLGLFKEEIPLECRIFRLIDSFHGMFLNNDNDDLHYQAAIARLQQNVGKIYDPALARPFVDMIKCNEDDILDILN
ncbi:diguanylate cyclase [Pectinatus frisingensis]|uniref:diguanylate cyclase n=1 Tax=Pectinatus frisingensis TaxID=865 RepID=UPI003D807C5D